MEHVTTPMEACPTPNQRVQCEALVASANPLGLGNREVSPEALALCGICAGCPRIVGRSEGMIIIIPGNPDAATI